MKLDRKILLKLMIAALLLTGASGVLAVLTGSWDVVGRVMLSSLVAAIAAGLMMPIAGWVDDEDTRASGLWGMALIILQFFCFISAIWIDFSGVEWRLLATGFILFPLGWPAIWIVVAKAGKPITLAKAAGLAVLAASSLAFIAGIWWEQLFSPTGNVYVSHDTSWKLIATGMVWYAYGALAAIALAGWTLRDKDFWRWLGPLGALTAAGLCTAGIWLESRERTPVLDISTGLAIFGAHAVFLSNLKLGANPAMRFVKLGAILLSGTTIALACAVSISDIQGSWSHVDTPLIRLSGAGTILSICATLALLITARINRGVNIDPQTASVLSDLIDLFCPRCKTRQTLPAGDSACRACGLRISIKLEEPRCASCGYLLYKITGTSCPDCGKPITTPSPT
jgi:hypothetical protein